MINEIFMPIYSSNRSNWFLNFHPKIFSFNINQDNSFQVNLDQIILTIKIKKEMDSRQSSISKRGSKDDENISI